MTKVKVLQIVAGMNVGGAETFLMNVLRNTDREKARFDFAQNKCSPSFYDEEIKNLGGQVFYCKAKAGIPAYTFNLYKILRGGRYDAVHTHCHYFGAFGLFAAWLARVPRRACHSHNISSGRKNTPIRAIYEFVTRRMILLFATHLYACSQDAGRALYGAKARFIVVPNGVQCHRFAFNPAARTQTRESLGLQNNFVLAHLGRFSKQKNHTFLLDIFNEVLKNDKIAKLLLIGIGELEEEIKQKAKNLGILQSVLFLGIRKDNDKLLQAADVFLLPSLYEGLPLAGLEAQAAGLPCLFTEGLSREMDIINCFYLPLDTQVWAQKIEQLKGFAADRTLGAPAVKKAGYDAQDAADILLKFYAGQYGN